MLLRTACWHRRRRRQGMPVRSGMRGNMGRVHRGIQTPVYENGQPRPTCRRGRHVGDTMACLCVAPLLASDAPRAALERHRRR